MLGIHVYWSKPTLTGTNGHHLKGEKEFKMFDFELLHFVLSALYWKELNGPIFLYTDPTFYNYLKSKNLDKIWDVIDTDLYEEFTELNVESKNNWTGFKTWLLQKVPAPFLFLDHDNLVYTKIPDSLYEKQVRFAHLEAINPYYYPDKEDMQVKGFEFNPKWKWDLDVANTCMLYFKDESIKNEYSKLALQFEAANNTDDKYLSEVQYLFSDQRLLVMMLEEKGIDYGTFSNRKFTPNGNIPDWTHIDDDKEIAKVGFDHTWAYKHHLVSNYDARFEYIDRHVGMINSVFPQYKSLLNQLFSLYY